MCIRDRDTSEYSFGYVAGWSSGRELAELKASLEIIRNAAHELISALDEHLAELRQQRETELSTAQEAAFAPVSYTHLARKAESISPAAHRLATRKTLPTTITL